MQEVVNHCKVYQINAAAAERERETVNVKRRGEEECECVCVWGWVGRQDLSTLWGSDIPIGIVKSEITYTAGSSKQSP